MAQARAYKTPARTRDEPPRRTPHLAVVEPTATDIKADPAKPTFGVHPTVIKLALAAAAWMTAALVLFFLSGEAIADYLLVIVASFAVLFFALTLGLARWAADDPRWSPGGPPPAFAAFVEDNTAIATGVVAGREAAIQILTLPIVLAIGATVLGIVFRVVT